MDNERLILVLFSYSFILFCLLINWFCIPTYYLFYLNISFILN